MAALPSAFWATIGPVASQLPLSLCNIICTNVPGPQIPLYIMGHKMLAWYPWVPIGGLMGINCAILTYNGTAYFGFTGDVHAAPDLERLEEFVNQSFAEFTSGGTAAADVTPQRKKRARPNAKIPVAPANVAPRRRKSSVAVAASRPTEPLPPPETSPAEKPLAVGA
jgi:diacylglycerol O-acyltransferase / wax synthase